MTGTSDLSDAHGDDVRVLEIGLHSYGGRRSFHGEIVTVKCFEDNARVKEVAGTPGAGKVLVVDGGGSRRHALLGNLIGADAVAHGWEGVVVFGAVRDVEALATLDLGVLEIGLHPAPERAPRRRPGRDHRVVRQCHLPAR